MEEKKKKISGNLSYLAEAELLPWSAIGYSAELTRSSNRPLKGSTSTDDLSGDIKSIALSLTWVVCGVRQGLNC